MFSLILSKPIKNKEWEDKRMTKFKNWEISVTSPPGWVGYCTWGLNTKDGANCIEMERSRRRGWEGVILFWTSGHALCFSGTLMNLPRSTTPTASVLPTQTRSLSLVGWNSPMSGWRSTSGITWISISVLLALRTSGQRTCFGCPLQLPWACLTFNISVLFFWLQDDVWFRKHGRTKAHLR